VKEAHLTTPISEDEVRHLVVGDTVYISGLVYTARDMAHLRLKKLLAEGKPLPEDFRGSVIFHAGPVVKKDRNGWKLWVIGPTTSTRMEPYADMVGRLGVRVIVGKGGMGEHTIPAYTGYGMVYLLAAPGCGVVHAEAVKRVLRVHWLEDFGMPEAIWVLEVADWGPLIVGIDSQGKSLFKDIADRAAALQTAWFPKPT
jgi:fumarate hydratase subunit beta